jgi:hypothetical protein
MTQKSINLVKEQNIYIFKKNLVINKNVLWASEVEEQCVKIRPSRKIQEITIWPYFHIAR